MKRLLIVLIFFSSGTFLTGQQSPEIINNFSVEVSDPYRWVEEYTYVGRITEDGFLYDIKRLSEGILVRKFKVENTPAFVEERLITNVPPYYDINAFIEINGKWQLFYSVFEKEFTTEKLFVRELDLNAMSFSGEEKLLVSIDGKLTGSPFMTVDIYMFDIKMGEVKGGVIDKFQILQSHNEDKILVQYKRDPEFNRKSKIFYEMGMVVFDPNLNKLWEAEVEMPYSGKKMRFKDYAVDSEGNAYILGQVFNDDSEKFFLNGKINYKMELFKIDHTGTLSAYPIDMRGFCATSIVMLDSGQDYVSCLGYYNEHEDFWHANGTILVNISKDGEIRDFVTNEFPVEVLNQYESAGTAKKNIKKESKKPEQVVFENLKLRNVAVQEDGSLLVVGEQYEYKERYMSSHDKWYTYNYYNDILVSKLNSRGEVMWNKKLPKSQVGGDVGKGSMGLSHAFANGNHYIFYMDHLNNSHLPINEAPATYMENGFGKGMISAHLINDKTGAVSKLNIVDTRNVTFNLADNQSQSIKFFRPHKIVNIDNERFVFESYKNEGEGVLIGFAVSD